MHAVWQQIRAAARVGWEVESNWTRRWVYILWAAARPLAFCLTLFFLFRVVSDAPGREAGFLCVYVGSAFFSMVITITATVSWVILDDREHYQLIRYIYITPMRLFVYILGRSLPILGVSVISLLIILAFGLVVLKLPLGPGNIDWLLMGPTLALGLVTTAALGILFAGLLLVTARHSLLLAEGAGAMFLLVCGVMYPIDFMPPWLAAFSKTLPMTYWMEMVRRSFGLRDFSPALAGWSEAGLTAVFALSTAALCLVAVWTFRRMERLAKRLGKLDQATNY